MTTLRRLALIAALALLPIVPYALLGYTGQDLPFHVGSWLDLKAGWQAGHLRPGWSAAANFGRGDPHLTFYPPVSCYLGALLVLILPLKFAPAAFVWITLVLGGISMYAASKPFLAERDRLTAAILYMLGPYTVTTSLVRFAAAELLVQAWLPLIALYFYKAIWAPTSSDAVSRSTRQRVFVVLALLLGLGWVTNIPASIVLLYSFAAAAALCAVLKRSIMPMLRMIVAEAVAAASASFYLLPAWKERPWIHADILLHVDPSQLLLFMQHSDFNDNPLLITCWIFLCVQALLAIACLRRRTLSFAADPAVSTWVCLAIASFILQSPLAIPLWQHAPELRFVQFPLRFLSIIGVALPLLLLSRGTRPSLRRPAYILTAVLSIAPFLAYLSEQAISVNRAAPLPRLIASWQQKGAPEYLPTGSLMPVGPANLPDVSSVNPKDPVALNPDCQITRVQQNPDLRTFQTISTVACKIRLTTYFYPYWHATDESHRSIAVTRDSTGFLLVDVPPGSHTISVAFHTTSPLRAAGATATFITLVLLGACFALNCLPRSGSSRQRSAPQVP